ncbi:MAG: GspE/PulE family protein [Nitrosomonas sp.]|uniref:GspE/PulE family protein n=1 Tax=Nitrosomonas sp. TaxID=42353 RepID=UPI0027224E08|nr:GspE/PulE family protein [Nitrosomonas sp.]MDO8895146.1 GspE/PulE family protein [Nitrosomonas sp.]MDP1786290.1 GspE/PulE family protein [Nitrosomonas sp.]MDP1933970.1 GspE/PulE family protein [Nitrosomonas sp.]MDP2223655.1 GspE/PulE family protein [Nitrosomonas sp.]MDP3279737.1 GspE/PulE family protein [Nitrosomonas sp.]
MIEASIQSGNKQPIDLSRLADVRRRAFEQGISVIQILDETGGYTPDELVQQLGKLLHMPVLEMKAIHALSPAFDRLPFAEAIMHECVLFRRDQNYLLAVSNPFSNKLRAWAEERFDMAVEWYLVHPADLTAFFTQQEKTMRAMDQVLPSTELDNIQSGIEDLSLKSINAGTSQVVRLVHSTLYDAHKSQASDIHLEMTTGALSIKYRIDGVLTSIGVMQGADLAEQVISRIKVMSELDIAERRVPQDGRFKISIQGREIDFRVSIMPSIFGEDAVLRILDRQALSDHIEGLTLNQLGFNQAAIATIRRLSSEPYGMLLVTGPTGSGKTTSLYAAISEVNHGHDKIVTIEDPIEYQLPGVLQIPVNEKKGLTFARGLRSILRHDPDKIMVGEIRDAETAQIAIQAALTGHLVFTTVHANNVFDVIGRFSHMGVDPYSFVSALNGIVAQRLVRLLCVHCAVDERPDDKLIAESGISAEEASQFKFRSGKGCGQCRGSGYRGRNAIAEILILNDEIRELIVAQEPIRRIKEAARNNGTRFLREGALDMVRQGLTSLEEANRVTIVA